MSKDKDLSIYPLRDVEDRMNRVIKEPLANIPFFIGICGRVRSGKTVLINSLFLSERFYSKDFDVKIIISSTVKNDPVNKHLLDEFDMIFDEYSDELLKELVKMIEQDESNAKYVIILDDVIGDMKQKKSGSVDYITGLSTKYRHIGNQVSEGKLSLVVVTQYFKFLTPILRNNLSAYYLMGKFSQNELAKISDALSYFGGGDKGFLEIYKKSRKGKYDFLFLNVEAMEARRNHQEILWSEDMDEDEPVEEVEEIIEEKKEE